MGCRCLLLSRSADVRSVLMMTSSHLKAWDSVNNGQWKQKFFPMDYRTSTETVTFVVPNTTIMKSGGMGVWRSQFRATCESCDPGAFANASANTSYLVRENDAVARARSDGLVAVSVVVSRDQLVTLSTAVAGVPSRAPVLPSTPPPDSPACTFPNELSDNFDALTPGSEAKYFQAMHGAFEAVPATSGGVVLRQMSVGQPIGFHGTDDPPLTNVGHSASASMTNVTISVMIEPAPEPSPSRAEPASSTSSSSSSSSSASHPSPSSSGNLLPAAVIKIGSCFLQVEANGTWTVGTAYGDHVSNHNHKWAGGVANGIAPGKWHRISMQVESPSKHKTVVSVDVDGVQIDSTAKAAKFDAGGWVGIGASKFAPVQYDDFVMRRVA